jgi:pyruvate/2-oxoglutarate dehydrogenase complex dihydrolipoamide dehydrogenase (E3) component
LINSLEQTTTLPQEQQAPADEFPVTIHPMDEHNRALLRNVRPANWRNPEPSGRYNLVVIGSGTAGLVGSIGGAGLGARVALIEKHMMGGDCLNWGCVPSKSVIRPARIMADLRRGRDMGIHIPEGVEVDFGQVMARMRQIRAAISHDDSVARVQGEGVELYLGAARFTGPDTIEVVDGDRRQTLHFAKALIATGSKATVAPIEGIHEIGYLTNETLFQLTELPRRLAVIGGGPIGVEMAQAFARLGSQVTLLQKADQILPREDKDAARIVQQAMVDDGVQLVVSANVNAVKRTEGGKLIHYEQGGESLTLEVDAILLSVGRSPAVSGLNLEAAGVEYNAKGVVVNDALQTTNPAIYASGDVAQPYQFTHVADATSRIVLQNALFPGPKKKLGDLVIPWCTFTDPEVAHVGMNEAEARAKGITVETLVHHLSHVDRSRTDGNTEGFVKIYVRQGTDKIVGATIVASEAGEMINILTLAIKAGAGLQTIATMIFPYPVQSEAIKKIADKYNRTRLTPLVRRLFKLWFQWRR